MESYEEGDLTNNVVEISSCLLVVYLDMSREVFERDHYLIKLMIFEKLSEGQRR